MGQPGRLGVDHYLEGGVAATLRALARLAREQRLTDRAAESPYRATQLARHTDEVQALEQIEERAAAGTAIDPVLVAATLRRLLADEDPIVVDETITHSRVVQRHLRRETPDSYFYVQGGLGQGIAVALGVKLAAPDRTVVFTVGDGAYLYNPIVQSLHASQAHDLPVLIVVFNDHKYLSMQMNHLRFYPDGAAVDTGEWLGVDLSTQPDPARFAEPFGFHTESVTTASDLEAALDRALKSVRGGTTAVVNVAVSR